MNASKNGSSKHTPRVAIIGGGPSAATLATLLAEKGIDVVMFTDGKRPDLIVGESLIPALIPIFRRLGIEDEVKAIAQLKPGATFRYSLEDQIELSFEIVRGILPIYSYNDPRPAFDRIVEQRAARAGVRCVETRAKLRRGTWEEPREVVLEDETLALIPEWEGRHPDLIVDATGRRRAIARLLDLSAAVGPRRDAAYFGHYEDFEFEGPPGQTLISKLKHGGWSWRIPLPDRLSVGVVLDQDTARKLGDTAEERLEAAIDRDPDLGVKGTNRKRISGDVPTYTNYQLISERGSGPGWVAVGDAYGFVDPMLSPGLYIAMWSAQLIANIVPVEPPRSGVISDRAFRKYGKQMHHMLRSWQNLIAAFYNGTIFSAHKTGLGEQEGPARWVSSKIERHMQRHLQAMACGAAIDTAYGQFLVRKLTRIEARNHEHRPGDLAIT